MKDREWPQHIWQLSMPAIRRYHHTADELPEGVLYRPATLRGVAAELDAYPTANLTKNDAPLMTTRIVVEGDILTELARHYYNDPRLANWIYQANLDTLDHPDDLFIGTELRIPEPPLLRAFRVPRIN
jgi:nucleoid-associated protein YgaU